MSNERSRRNEGRSDWKILKPEVDIEQQVQEEFNPNGHIKLQQTDEEIPYFTRKVAELSDKWSSKGVTTDEILKVSKTLHDFEKVEDFISGYVVAKENTYDKVEVSIDNQLNIYNSIETDGKPWQNLVSLLADTTERWNAHLIHGFVLAQELGSYDKIAGFLDYNEKVEQRAAKTSNPTPSIHDQLDNYQRRFDLERVLEAIRPEDSLTSFKSADEQIYKLFEQEQNRFSLSGEQLNQGYYRDDFRDSAHFYEHAATRFEPRA